MDSGFSERAGQRFKRGFLSLQLLGMFFLYPGFFLYHFSVAAGFLPPFLGGYYGLISFALLVTLIPVFVYGVKCKFIRLTKVDFAFLLFVAFILVWSLVHWKYGFPYQRDVSLLVYTLSFAVVWVVNYCVFRGLDLDRPWVVFSLLGAAVLMSLVAISGAQEGFFHARRMAESGSEEVVATYQGFARSAIVVFILLLALVPRAISVWVYFFGLVVLFLLGARSEFAAFIFVGVVGLYFRVRGLKFFLVSIPALVVGMIFLASMAGDFSETSRIFRILDFKQDSSLELRVAQIDRAIEDISRSPLIGHYGGYVRFGGLGDYAHNGISVWHGFGIVGFLFFIYLIWQALSRGFYSALIGRGQDSYAAICFLMAIFVTLMAVTAKAISFPLYAASWGLVAGLIERNGLPDRHGC